MTAVKRTSLQLFIQLIGILGCMPAVQGFSVEGCRELSWSSCLENASCYWEGRALECRSIETDTIEPKACGDVFIPGLGASRFKPTYINGEFFCYDDKAGVYVDDSYCSRWVYVPCEIGTQQ